MKVKDNWDINTSIHSRNRLSINAKARLSLLIAMVGILRTFFLIKFKKKQQNTPEVYYAGLPETS